MRSFMIVNNVTKHLILFERQTRQPCILQNVCYITNIIVEKIKAIEKLNNKFVVN